MKRAALAIATAVGLFLAVAIAQVPSEDKEVIPPRSVQLTAEQDHIIKEIVLKDMSVDQVPSNTEVKIGDRVPDEIKLQSFPPLVAEKVPQIKTHKFFVTQNKVVIVAPQDNVVADIIK
jgi:hypothetical protein